jgi:hypothetical protein
LFGIAQSTGIAEVDESSYTLDILLQARFFDHQDILLIRESRGSHQTEHTDLEETASFWDTNRENKG